MRTDSKKHITPTDANNVLAVRIFSVGDNLIKVIDGVIVYRDTITKVYKNGRAKGLTFRRFKIVFGNCPIKLQDGTSRFPERSWRFDDAQ